MSEDAPKRLTIAEKRALSNPLYLGAEDRVQELSVELPSQPDWTDAVLSEQSRKQPISLRVDPDVLDFFKSQGPGYQTRMNAVLQAYVKVKKDSNQP